MGDEDQALTVRISADVGDAESSFNNLAGELERLASVTSQVGDAAQESGDRQEEAAKRTTMLTREVGSAQQAVIDDMRARNRQYAEESAKYVAEGVAIQEAANNVKIASEIKMLEHRAQMGKMSLEQQLENLQKITAATQENSAARVASERAEQAVYKQLIQQKMSDAEDDVKASRMSEEARRAMLRQILEDERLSLANRKIGADDLARREEQDAERAAEVVKKAERDKALAAKESQKEIAESHKQSQDLAYLAMDVGYILPAAGQLSNAAYLMRDLGTVTGDMVVKVGALVVAFAALAGAVEVFKVTTDAAAKEQQSLEEISVAIRNQGGDWDKAREPIQEWATAAGRASAFSKQEVLSALNDLTERGVAYADAQRIINVGLDVATAKNKELIPTVESLSTMEGIRASGLVKLDYGLKQIIQSHGTQQQVLDYLSKTYSGQASGALETYDGKQKLLKDTLEHIGTEIGVHLIPYMDAAVTGVLGLAEVFDKSFTKIANAVGDATHKMGDFAAIVGLVHDQSPQSIIRAGAGFLDMTGLKKNNIDAPLASLTGPGSDWMRIKSEAEKRIRADKAEFEAIKNGMGTTLDHDGRVGSQKGGGGGPEPAESADKAANQAEMLTGVQEVLKRQLAQLSEGEIGYKQSVELATTAGEKQEAEMQLHKKIAADAAVAVKEIGTANNQLNTELKALTPQQAAQNDAYEKALHAYNAFVASLHGGKAETTEQKDSLHALKGALDQAWSAYNTTNQAVSKLTQELDANNQKLKEQQQHLLDVAIAQAQVDQKYNDSRISNSEKNIDSRNTHGDSLEQKQAYLQKMASVYQRLAESEEAAGESSLIARMREAEYENQIVDTGTAIQARNEDEAKRRAIQIQGLQDESATYAMSIQQEIRYYEQRYAAEVQADGQYSDEAKKLWDEIVKLQGESFKKTNDAHKQFINDMQTREESWLNTILTKHESFRSSLKTIWQGILADFEKNVEKMIATKALKGFNESIAGSFGPQAPTSAGAMGIFSSLLGAPASSGSGNLPDGTSNNPVYIAVSGTHSIPGDGKRGVDVGAAAQTNGIFGAALGSAGAERVVSALPTDGGLLGLLMGTSSAATSTSGSRASASGADMQTFSGGSWDKPSSTSSSIATGLKNFGLGAAVGSALEPQYNQTNGSIGSALGSIAGLVSHANPLAGAALAIGGSLIGGLIGPHETAQQTPDVSQPGYQQWFADWQGQVETSNGTNTYASAAYDTSIGNQSWASQIASYINTPANYANAPQGVMVAIQAMQSLEGSSKDLSLNPNNPQSQGIFHFKNGQNASVTQVQAWVQTIQEWIGQSGGSSSNVFTVSRTYPSAGNPASAANAGNNGSTYTPVAVNVPTTTTPSSLRTTEPVAGGVAASATGVGGSTVHVTVQGSVIGATGVQELALILSQAMNQVSTGSAPGKFGIGRTLAGQGNF